MHRVGGRNLDKLIGCATAKVTQRSQRGESATTPPADEWTTGDDGLLFLGNPHETVPRALLLDTRLGAVDKIGWQMIRLLASDDRTTAFPTYDQLQPLLRSGIGSNASRGTVARVMSILRLTRWLSLAHRARHKHSGRIMGNVYILHDEPVTPIEAPLLDEGYLDFVISCCRHKNRVVREVACAVRDELIADGISLGKPATSMKPDLSEHRPLDRYDRRAQRFQEMETAQFSTRTKSEINDIALSSPREPGQSPSENTPSSLRELSLKSNTYSLVPDENSATTVVRSCNTTTTVGKGSETGEALFWPAALELGPQERGDIAHLLASLPHQIQQSVLDEAAGRVDAGVSHSPIGLLRTLAIRASKGEFRPTRHAQHQAARRGDITIPVAPQRPLPDTVKPIADLQKGHAERERIVSREEANAARSEMLTMLGIRR